MPKKWIVITFTEKITRHTFSRVLQPILAWGYNYKLTANSKAGFLSAATLDNAIAPFHIVESISFHPCHNFVFKTVQYTITNMSNELHTYITKQALHGSVWILKLHEIQWAHSALAIVVH